MVSGDFSTQMPRNNGGCQGSVHSIRTMQWQIVHKEQKKKRSREQDLKTEPEMGILQTPTPHQEAPVVSEF